MIKYLRLDLDAESVKSEVIKSEDELKDEDKLHERIPMYREWQNEEYMKLYEFVLKHGVDKHKI